MGTLMYGNSAQPIEIPDRILAHAKVVIATKLRRNESFTLSWVHAGEEAPGRTTLWIQPSIPLRFVFGSPEPESLDPRILKEMADLANSSGGLMLDLASATADARDRSLTAA